MEDNIKQLSVYFKENLAKGILEADLKKASLSQGWSEIDINKALDNEQIPLVAAPRNLMAIFSYLGILFWVPIFFCKENPTLKFHIKQGFVLFLAEVATGLLTFFDFKIWLGIIIFLLMLVWIVLSLIGIKNIIKNKEANLPIIGKLALKINFPHMRV